MMYKHLAALAQRYRLVLASGSPRRFRLLTETGVAFAKIVPQLEEAQEPGEAPFAFARRLAEDKALEVGQKLERDQIALGCDTIVVLGDQILGKPTNTDEAVTTLSQLAGQKHVVCTAVAFVREQQVIISAYDTTNVVFNQVSATAIREYVATGEPADKAGAYGIQGMGAFLVDRIEGQLDTVIGLPRTLLDSLSGEILNREQGR